MFVKRCGFNLISVRLVKMGIFKDVLLMIFLSLLFLQIDRNVPLHEKKLQVLNMQNTFRIKRKALW